MKKLTFSLIFATVIATMSAKQISVSEAAAVAQKYLPAIEASSAKPLKKSVNTTVSSPEYYIFNAPDGNGFVIVSGDDRLTEVVGYSDKGSFIVSDNMPTAIKNYLDNYSKYVQSVRQGNTQPNNKNIQYASAPVVAPLVTTKWDQEEPYNRQCPYDVTTKAKCPTGCSATALAQVMNFHEWPATGVGSNTYANKYGTFSVDFTKSNYDWANMKDTYTMYNTPDGIVYEYTDTEANAVAKLMWDCGVALNMVYGAEVSGATDSKLAYAATNHFNYNSEYICRNSCFGNQFLDKIKAALDASKPVVFCGQGDMGGHAFVADGYDANNFLHINWGWSGISDGYFSIDDMDPYSLGTGGGSGGFNNDQTAIILTPCTSGTPTSNQIPLAIYEDSNGYFKANSTSWNKGDSFITSICQIWNQSDDKYTGEVASGIFTLDGTLVAQSSSKKITNLGSFYIISSVYNHDLTSQVKALTDGEYRIKPISKISGASEWVCMSTLFYVDIVVEGNKVTVANRAAELQLIGSITSNKESYSVGETATFYINIENLSDVAAIGKLKLLIRDATTNAKKKTVTETINISGLTQSGVSMSFSINESTFAIGNSYKVEIDSYTPTSGDHVLLTPDSGYECIINIADPEDGAVETITTDAVRVYPNPATDYIRVSADNVTSLELYTTSGSLVKSANGNELYVSDCPTGMYILSITTPKYTKRQTVIVK